MAEASSANPGDGEEGIVWFLKRECLSTAVRKMSLCMREFTFLRFVVEGLKIR